MDTHTHKPSTVTLAEHARRGLIMRQLAIIIVTRREALHLHYSSSLCQVSEATCMSIGYWYGTDNNVFKFLHVPSLCDFTVL